MTAYYNEIDPYAAQWLRNLIAAGHIAPGDVDERSIEDVTPNELKSYTQCHFFAGIGVWSKALRDAGWDDTLPVWTGSCPCQPFSAAGKGAGFADERHLWPAWFHLIGECKPPVIFGEQVAGKNGLAWLDLVQADVERLGYACGAVVAPAAGFGAPHIRERLYWVAYAERAEEQRQRRDGGESLCEQNAARPARSGVVSRLEPEGRNTWMLQNDTAYDRLGNTESNGRERRKDDGDQGRRERASGQASSPLACGQRRHDDLRGSGGRENTSRTAQTNGVWGAADWLYCTDGKWRPVEPGTFPLAHGVANRVGKLRAYGNAIVPEQAKEVITAFMRYAP